ncbi:MAG: hypothetical protein IH598_07425 [Bacteroidales bacterium]|nr:hypothetical protein [Bacteroidales bacterium]
MTVDEFILYPLKQRANIVLSEGIELMDRIYIFYHIKLFRYSDFFVEIWFLQISKRIDKILVVKQEDVLHLYEKNIDISDLFENK